MPRHTPPQPPTPDDWQNVDVPTSSSPGRTSGTLRGWLRPAPNPPPNDVPSSSPPTPPPSIPPPPSLFRSALCRLHEVGLALVTATASLALALARVRAALASRLEPVLPAPQNRLTALVAAALLALAARHVRTLRVLKARDRDCRALAAALAALHRAVLGGSGSSGASAGVGASQLHPLLAAAGYTKEGLVAGAGSEAASLAAVVLGEITQAAVP